MAVWRTVVGVVESVVMTAEVVEMDDSAGVSVVAASESDCWVAAGIVAMVVGIEVGGRSFADSSLIRVVVCR